MERFNRVSTSYQETIKIGIVDDDVLALRLLAILLKQSFRGHPVRVVWAERFGDVAVMKCANSSTRPDVMLVDMGMDDVDGSSVCRRIRYVSDRIALLCMTAHSLNRYRDTARHSGAQCLLDKADWGAFKEHIERYVNGGDYIQDGFLSPKEAYDRFHHSRDFPKKLLSMREIEVMDLTVEGLTAKEVSLRLAISESTVKTHVRHVIEKLDVKNKFQAIQKWNEIKGLF